MNTRHHVLRKLTALISMLIMGLIAHAQQPAFLTNGLVAYYPFNGDAKDESGQSSHFGSQPDFSVDRFGKSKSASQFSSPRPINSTPITVPGTGFTVSYWIYLDTLPNQEGERILLHGSHNVGWNSSEAASFGFAVFRDGRFGVSTLRENLIGGSIGVSSGTIAIKKWYHIGMSSGGGITKLFIDGNKVGSDPGVLTTRTFPLTLGGESSFFFQSGSIDDVRIYNRALSDAEVAALHKYESTPPDNSYLTNGLVAYYPFDGNAKDESGNQYDGVAQNLSFIPNRHGVASASGAFNGQNTSVTLPISLGTLLSGSSPLTISCWVFSRLSPPDDNKAILQIGPPNQNAAFAFFMQGGSGFLGYSQWGSEFDLVCDVPLNDGVWHHCVASLSSNSELSLFVDGSFIKSRIVASARGVAAPTIGAGPYSPYYWPGSIDDMRIYTRSLSASEVSALYKYESVPQKPVQRQATAKANVVNGFVVGATIIDGGIGYTTPPNVVISGGGGSGAIATATIDVNGRVNSITLVSSGSKYTGIPTIIIDPPPFPPSQAKGTSTAINGFVTDVIITDTGHGYEGVIPPVTFLGGGGSGAKGTAIVSNGMVTGISMTASGSGYTNAPYVLIAAPPGLATAAIDVSQVRVTLSLIPGYTYKIQTTTDSGTTWKDVETGILAVDATLVRTFDVTTNTQLFRVVQLN